MKSLDPICADELKILRARVEFTRKQCPTYFFCGRGAGHRGICAYAGSMSWVGGEGPSPLHSHPRGSAGGVDWLRAYSAEVDRLVRLGGLPVMTNNNNNRYEISGVAIKQLLSSQSPKG